MKWPETVNAGKPFTDEQFAELLTAIRASRTKPVMDTDEAAAYLVMSTQNLELLRLNGGGPKYAKLGRLVRYRKVSLDRWLAENERSHTAEGCK